VSFAAITICIASQRVFIVVVVVHFVIDSVRKLLDTPSYVELLVAYFKTVSQYEAPQLEKPASRTIIEFGASRIRH